MNPPLISDIFKFLAVRPPQRVSDEDTHQTIIRDVRAANPDGVRELASLASDLARPEAALARWRELDLSLLAPLVASHRALVRRYEQLGPTDAVPDGRKALNEAGATKIVNDSRTLRQAWDALYVADSTGADAGLRFEVPLAALRVLHLAALVDEQKTLTRSAALEALSATPAIPHAFHDVRISSGTLSATVDRAVPVVAVPENSAHSMQMRSLAQDLLSTQRVLGLVTNAPPAPRTTLTTGGTSERLGPGFRSQVEI